MATISSKTWTGVADDTLVTAAPAETGSALTKSSLSAEGGGSAATGRIVSDSVVPGESSGNEGYFDDATPAGSSLLTAHAKHYTGDHGNGLATVYINKISTAYYELMWLQGSSQFQLRRNGSSVATAGASGLHDQVLDYYLQRFDADSVRAWVRRSNGDYWTGSAWQASEHILFDYTDGSPLSGPGSQGFGYRLAAHTGSTRQRVEAWDIDGTAASSAPVLSSPSGSVTSNTAATVTHNTDTVSDGTTHYLRRTGGSAASAATIISTGESQATGGSTGQSKSVTLLGGTANQYVDIAQDGTGGDSNVITVGPLTTATTLSSPTGTATGNTTATVGLTTDRAISAAFPAYFLTLPAATAAPADAAALIADGATVSQTTGGTTPTRALTGLTTATAYRTHFCQPGSNVVSSASYTPSTLTYSGTIGAQGGVQGAAHVWSGAAPSTLVSGGIGTKTWTGSGLGASGLTVNGTSGQLQGTYGTPGTYNITLTCTDSSTAGTNPTGGGSPPQTVLSNTFVLTITATGSPPTVATNPTNLTVTDGATASFTASFAGSPIPSLQWQEFIGGVWTAMSGETGNVLALGVVDLLDSGRLFRLGGTNTAGGPVYTSSATLTVTAASVGTITSDIFAGWGDDTPIASTTINFVTIERVSTGAITLQLTGQVTETDGRLIITNAAITPGVEYMLWCRNTAGTIRGGKKYTAT